MHRVCLRKLPRLVLGAGPGLLVSVSVTVSLQKKLVFAFNCARHTSVYVSRTRDSPSTDPKMIHVRCTEDPQRGATVLGLSLPLVVPARSLGSLSKYTLRKPDQMPSNTLGISRILIKHARLGVALTHNFLWRVIMKPFEDQRFHNIRFKLVFFLCECPPFGPDK